MKTEKTNFGGNPPAKSPDGETAPVKEDAKKETEGNRKSQGVEKLPNSAEEKPKTDRKEPKKQVKDSLPQNEKQEMASTKSKDIDGGDEKQNGDHEGIVGDKERKIAEKKMGGNVEKEDPAPENKPKDSKKVKTNGRKRDKSEGGEGAKVKKKPKHGDVAVKNEETRRMSDTSESTKNPRSASRESDASQTSKKSNNVFAETITAGLAEKPKKERRRRKTKTDDLGVVNLGVDNEENKNKIGTSKVKQHSDKEAKKRSEVRESPSLKDKTGNFLFTLCCLHKKCPVRICACRSNVPSKYNHI